MNILWINNVASVIGGTGGCTLSMIRSLPDCQHSVFSWGRFGETEYKAFPKDVKLVSGSNLRDFIGMTEYDLVVYQNTPFERMNHTFPNKPLTVYYLHSNHRSAKQAMKLCDMTLCVSNYLAELAGLDKETVLYQPVTIPPEIDDPLYIEWEMDYAYVFGRICTPNPSKWKKEDVVDLVSKILQEDLPKIGFHFIGASDPVRKELEDFDCCYFTDCSFEARGYLRKWDYLLYKSSLPETYGRTVKEAQRCGCVPIVSNLGGFKEQIIHGETGYLCADDTDFLAAVRKELFGDCIHPAEMGVIADLDGSCQTFRKAFLGRLSDYCSR